MRRFVLTAAFLASGIGAAGAADLPAKAAAAPVPEVYDFTGVYAGGGIGYLYENYDGSFVNPPPGSWNIIQDVAVAYAKVGGQYQFGSFVFGIEGQLTNILGDNLGSDCNPPGLCAAGGNMTGQFVNNIWSAGGRAGFAYWRLMPYVTAGYAQTRVDNLLNLPNGQYETARTSHDGYYVGGGFDWIAMPHVLLTIEYRHYEFNGQNATPVNAFTNVAVPGDAWTIKPRADMVTVGLAYLFNWAGPVVAKY
jgi:outer membrane immunogenic protein